MNERKITNKVLKEAAYYTDYYISRTGDIPNSLQNIHPCDFTIIHNGLAYFVEMKKMRPEKTLKGVLTDSQKKSFPKILLANAILFLVIVDEEKDICRIIRLKKYYEDIRVDGETQNTTTLHSQDFRANYIWQSLMWFIQEIEKE